MTLYVTPEEFSRLWKLAHECIKFSATTLYSCDFDDRRWVEGVAEVLGTSPEDLLAKVPPGSPPVDVVVWKRNEPTVRWVGGIL